MIVFERGQCAVAVDPEWKAVAALKHFVAQAEIGDFRQSVHAPGERTKPLELKLFGPVGFAVQPPCRKDEIAACQPSFIIQVAADLPKVFVQRPIEPGGAAAVRQRHEICRIEKRIGIERLYDGEKSRNIDPRAEICARVALKSFGRFRIVQLCAGIRNLGCPAQSLGKFPVEIGLRHIDRAIDHEAAKADDAEAIFSSH